MEKQLDQPGVARVTLEDEMTDYTDLIERLRGMTHTVWPYKKAADAIEALVKERDQNDINYNLEKADHERTKEELAALRKQIDGLQPNADRYELMRDMKLYEMQQYRCLPVPMEEAYDWFDAQIDAKIRERYPNATIGE